MATFYYSPNQNPPSPPAYIQPAAATAANIKWYDPNRTWGEWFGWSKRPIQPKGPTLPAQSDNLPYDHAFPFGVDPNDPSKPYAPYGFYYDDKGNVTTVPVVDNDRISTLQWELQQAPDASDPASPLNVYNVDSPMDPSNMQQFFYAAKTGSPWHQYGRLPDQPGTGDGYLNYSDNPFFAFKDTPENFPWLHDQDSSHHYRNGLREPLLDPGVAFTITAFEKIYLDFPVAPAGWEEVLPAGNSAAK